MEHAFSNGDGLENAFPALDYHTRWDATWQKHDHPAVLDWLNFESALLAEEEKDAWVWELLNERFQ